jgi:dienelactone hydrolase
MAGNTVPCPTCQQALQLPMPPATPLAPIVNPFSDDEGLVTAELVPLDASPTPPMSQSQDPFGGQATIGGSTTGYPQADGYAAKLEGPYTPSFGERRKKSKAIYYVLAAMMFGLFGFAAVVGIGIYQIIEGIDGLNFEGAPLPVQEEDYATARTQFETELLSRGAAPQEWDELEVPDGAAELVYQSDGHNLRAFISQPTIDGEPRPGVVFLHGGFAWGDSDWDMSRPYRDRGFVVMTPVLRGENGQPGHFSLYYDEVDDVLAATDAFAALPYVDETQLYIAGHSAGGTLAALTAMTSDRFLAIASYSGSMNQDGAGDWDLDLLVYDDLDEEETLMRSPEAFAKSFKCPAQLYYGSEEHWLQAECERTAATAQDAGLQVRAHRVLGNHFTSVLPAMMRSISFFEQQGRASGLGQRITQAVAPLRIAPDQILRPEPPILPDISLPDPIRRSIPTLRRPNLPTPSRPSLRATFPLLHQGMVTIEVTGYSGRRIELVDARRALLRHRWADQARIEYDEVERVIRVPVRSRVKLNTDNTKLELEKVGFEIGEITFTPNGEVDDSQVAEETEDPDASE